MTYLMKLLKDVLCILLFGFFMLLFLFAEEMKDISFFNRIPSTFFNINTIFLSIILEAIPFILLGVFVSAIIQSFVSENAIRRVLPRNAYLAVIPAALLGIIFPICECAIIPVVRRLIKKGMPSHVGDVFMLSAPILNPVVKSTSVTDNNSLLVNNKNNPDDPPEPLTETQYNKLKQDMLQTKNINFNDRSYVPMMTIIQDNLQSMIGKIVSTKGFVYREKNFMQNQIIIARFGISCCVADATVFGIMAKGDVAALPKDKWVQVSGTIEQTKYDGGTIPFIKIKKISIIAPPKQPYVFDVGVKIE